MTDAGRAVLIQVSLLGLALLVEFLTIAFATSVVARRMGIEDVTYGRALGATFLRDAGILVAVTALTGVGLPLEPSALGTVTVIPVVVHRYVFETSWGRAALLWLLMLLAEAVVAGIFLGGAAALAARLGAPLTSYWQFPLPVPS